MRIISYSLCAILIGGTLSFADDKSELLERLERLENSVKALESENRELKESIIVKKERSVREELGLLEERLDEVEMLTLMDKIEFGVGFRQRVDYIKREYADGSSDRSKDIYSTKVHLNMDSKISDNLKFTGRLGMYKYWADSAMMQMSNRDSLQARRPNDSGLYVERAYVDWLLNKHIVPITLTIGRQPSSDGPSHQFKDNTVRKSTYSALAFDGAVDGAVLTFDFENSVGLKNSAIRLAYGKAYQVHDMMSYNGSTINSQSGDRLKDTHTFGIFIDSSIPTIDNTLVQLGYVKAQDLPGMDMTVQDGANENLGDFDVYGLMVEGTNILNSGLDLFIHYGMSESKPNGKAWNGMGLMTSTPNDMSTKKGNAFWAGARYELPKDIKVGYEYNKGSRYWFNFTGGSNDPTNKLATRGDAHELYIVGEINRYAFLRAGATMIDYDYTGSGDYRGAPMKLSDLPDEMKSSNLSSLTNYYLLFNLMY